MARKRSQALQTNFVPRHPAKYKGTYPIVLRSSWEREFAMYLDLHEGVLQWASETSPIPYKNPLTGKQSLYVPDFMITYKKRGGTVTTKLIEIKPAKEALVSEAKTVRDKQLQMVNEAKWLAAMAWCKRRGIGFEVITEMELFGTKPSNKTPKAPKKVPATAKGALKTNKPKKKNLTTPKNIKVPMSSKVRKIK